MKALALTVIAAAGLLCSASTADAQIRFRTARGYSYSTPNYFRNTQTYSYSYPNSYSYPFYFGGNPVVRSGYSSLGTGYSSLGNNYGYSSYRNSGYVPGTVIYAGGNYYNPAAWSPYGGYSSNYGRTNYGVTYPGTYYGGRGWRR